MPETNKLSNIFELVACCGPVKEKRKGEPKTNTWNHSFQCSHGCKDVYIAGWNGRKAAGGCIVAGIDCWRAGD